MSQQNNILHDKIVESLSKSKSHRAIAELREQQSVVANHQARAARERSRARPKPERQIKTQNIRPSGAP
eukprot:scaffold161580_cov54-Cyclotella_meneghiniana.AAC.2